MSLHRRSGRYSLPPLPGEPSCAENDCNRVEYAKGLCRKHYDAKWKNDRPGYKSAASQKYKKRHPDRLRAMHRRIETRFSSGRTQAKRAKREWSITLDQYSNLIQRPCRYCCGPLDETGSGLDRIDNRGG